MTLFHLSFSPVPGTAGVLAEVDNAGRDDHAYFPNSSKLDVAEFPGISLLLRPPVWTLVLSPHTGGSGALPWWGPHLFSVPKALGKPGVGMNFQQRPGEARKRAAEDVEIKNRINRN